VSFGKAGAYLATALPADSARSLAVDGDVWIVTSTGEIARFRRNPLVTTASRVDFIPRWSGAAPHPTTVQAISGQSNLYVLDAPGRLVVQMSRDGRELVRIALPATLPPATAFYVSEASRIAYTLHGSKIVATSLDR